MSTGLNCEILQTTDGRWWYVLEKDNAPKVTWDWREYATGYGPFASEDAAVQHLSKHHANPGGWSVSQDIDRTTDPLLDRLLTEAEARRDTERTSRGG